MISKPANIIRTLVWAFGPVQYTWQMDFESFFLHSIKFLPPPHHFGFYLEYTKLILSSCL